MPAAIATPAQLIDHVVKKRRAAWNAYATETGLPPVEIMRQIKQTAGSLVVQIQGSSPTAVGVADIDAAFDLIKLQTKPNGI